MSKNFKASTAGNTIKTQGLIILIAVLLLGITNVAWLYVYRVDLQQAQNNAYAYGDQGAFRLEKLDEQYALSSKINVLIPWVLSHTFGHSERTFDQNMNKVKAYMTDDIWRRIVLEYENNRIKEAYQREQYHTEVVLHKDFILDGSAIPTSGIAYFTIYSVSDKTGIRDEGIAIMANITIEKSEDPNNGLGLKFTQLDALQDDQP